MNACGDVLRGAEEYREEFDYMRTLPKEDYLSQWCTSELLSPFSRNMYIHLATASVVRDKLQRNRFGSALSKYLFRRLSSITKSISLVWRVFA